MSFNLSLGIFYQIQTIHMVKCLAPGEARTHGLQIMRLTRCLLRYGGWWEASVKASPLETVGTNICQNYLSEVGFEPTPS